MSGPKPRCALCGGSLRRRASITYTWDILPGEPAVAWHAGPGSCWERDSCARIVVGSDVVAGAALIAEIASRGPGRVVDEAPQRPRSAAVLAAR